MLNSKIYQALQSLSEQLMTAANAEDYTAFDQLHAELKKICLDHENTDKDHPEQWETLADFTEDLDEALVIYEKAKAKADAITSAPHQASIGLSMASVNVELGNPDTAKPLLVDAALAVAKTDDLELKEEIDELIAELNG